MADIRRLEFYGSQNGFLENPCRTSNRDHRSKLLSFRENRVLYAFWRQTNKGTDKQTNRWTAPMPKTALAVASGGLTSGNIRINSVQDIHRVPKMRLV